MTEQWKPIEGYEDIYEVSDQGRVKRIKGDKGATVNKILKGIPSEYGYVRITLSSNGKRRGFSIHRLVATAFCDKPESDELLEVNHKNGIKTDNQTENLEWCTRSQNLQHAYDVLNRETPRGETHVSSKLTEEDVILMRRLYEIPGISQQILAARFGIRQGHVSHIVNRKKWTHI